MANPLSKFTIAVSGSQKGYTQVNLESLIASNGGAFVKAIEPGTTHLVTTQADVDKRSAKVRSAQASGIHVVSLDWLLESIESKKALAETGYVFGSIQPAPTTTTVAGKSADGSDPAQPPRRMSKRTASNLKDMAKNEDQEEEKPAPKKTKGSQGKSKRNEDQDVDMEDAPPKAADGVKTVKGEDEEDTKDAAKPEEKKAKASTKGKGKAKKEPTPEPEEVKPKMKTVIKKGKAPVDEYCPLANRVHVYVDGAGVVYDATLNQTDIGNNNNKFYYCQLLESDPNINKSYSYSVWVRFGRVGERGQTKMYVEDVSHSQALSVFQKQFRSKTGQPWENRADAHGGPKRYAFLERNYEEAEEEDADEDAGGSAGGEAAKLVKSSLAKPLQNLMQLIFNTDIMQQSMASMSYDSNKLPLGKLSKEVISRGYQTLKDIGEVIEQKPGYLQKFSDFGSNRVEILNRLSNRYYTVIPHSFGRNVPPVIDSGPKLKREVELIENLSDMALTTKIMNDTRVASTDGIHPLDKQFGSLGLNEAIPLDKYTPEFKNLEAYVKKTQGKTHRMNLKVEEIFRVTRSVEEEHWQNAGWDKLASDNRYLLWHGSRTTNFAGILSQGLRIAPPEAPVNGYMFGKGIYLADIVSKSANYCCAGSSNNTGLLLLCEAQLGDPMFELNGSDYNAAQNCAKANALATKGLGRSVPLKWEDASVVNESLKGVKMPAVTAPEANITGDDPTIKQGSYRSLQYNEYIVYKTSQVKIRYLFRCRFN
ncbi:uncharacterized protein LAJ45_10783 [Morchella importuna]|uniref:Poly [ADP-ribose] polymerase n=1 Tax=Morchella conica CCBAS932 TaxID=1392247 RepID=A0A3N4KBM2_9PEZI|nr:uncharacterized protein LAJ45_10783 [Morchella importuna]KAH8145222.1 hypothetical protein LAJ45_10783 [Morchella importuna]RPB07890.1 PARP-domain-containing protein [Morchella conica CCBAS932]